MGDMIVLRRADGSDAFLGLSSSPPEVAASRLTEVIYQDAEYRYELFGESFDALDDQRAWIGISVAGRRLRTRSRRVGDHFVVEPDDRASGAPFRLLYGSAGLEVVITRMDGDEIVLFSDLAAIAVDASRDETTGSVLEMLDYIMSRGGRIADRPRTMRDDEARVMGEIARTLERILPTVGPASPFEPQVAVMPGRTERLLFARYGVHRRAAPRGPVGSPSLADASIVGFVDALRRRATARADEIARSLDAMGSADDLIADSGYRLSTGMIERVARSSALESVQLFRSLASAFAELGTKYRRALRCERASSAPLALPPSASLDRPRRTIFRVMTSWAAHERAGWTGRASRPVWSSGDSIYERFCLLALIESIESLGWREDRAKRRRFVYDGTPRPSGDNTFVFEGPRGRATLYSQPVIPSRPTDGDNGITLFRVDTPPGGGIAYFMPDFLIKIERDGHRGAEWAVLDAKWRLRSHILERGEGGLADIAYKYFFSTADRATALPVSFIWIMQGKDDEHRTAYRHRSSAASRSMPAPFASSIGVVSVTPRSGIGELTKMMRDLLER